MKVFVKGSFKRDVARVTDVSLLLALQEKVAQIEMAIDATMTLSAGPAVEKQIDQVVYQGYKKWPKPKKKKK